MIASHLIAKSNFTTFTFQRAMNNSSAALLFACLSIIQMQYCVLLEPVVCQRGCNSVWMACYEAAGGADGITTAGAGVSASILSCNEAQDACMDGCASGAVSLA